MAKRVAGLSVRAWMFLFAALLFSQHVTLLNEFIPVTLLALPVAVAWLLVKKRARLDYFRLRIFIFLMGCVGASYYLNVGAPEMSQFSGAYFLSLMVPFIFNPKSRMSGRATREFRFWDAYRNIILLACLLGFVQVLQGEALLSLRDFVPEEFRVGGYNTTNAVSYGSSLYRANGFFFYEPSFFSQFIGVAILVEMRLRRNPLVLGIYLLGMVSTFSGTGLVLLTVGLLIQAAQVRVGGARRIFISILPLVVLVGAGVFVFPEFFLARLGEFAQENSSAYIRFVSPAIYVFEAYSSGLGAFLFGVGPGLASSVRVAEVMADFPGAGKVLYEYGLVGGVLTSWLYYDFCKKVGAVNWMVWPLLLVQFLLNNGVFTPIALMSFWLFTCNGHFEAAILRRTQRRGRRPGARLHYLRSGSSFADRSRIYPAPGESVGA